MTHEPPGLGCEDGTICVWTIMFSQADLAALPLSIPSSIYMCIYGVQMQRLEEHSADAGEGAVGFRTVSDGGRVLPGVFTGAKKSDKRATWYVDTCTYGSFGMIWMIYKWWMLAPIRTWNSQAGRLMTARAVDILVDVNGHLLSA